MAGVSEDRERWEHLAEGNAKQARKRVAADAVIRDEQGRVLLVNPTYKRFWDLPGGMAEANEPPRTALERELREELGLNIRAGRLLVLDWSPPRGPWDDQLVFLFDGGTLGADQIATLRILDPEISDWMWVSADEATAQLHVSMAERLDQALQAHIDGTTVYREMH